MNSNQGINSGDESWTAMEGTSRGTLITVEGLDGSGKSTLVRNLVSRLGRDGRKVVVTREPGGPARLEGEYPSVAQILRKVLVEPHALGITEKLPHEATLFLFIAARFAHMNATVLPALREGAVVLCDRFYGSTFAFQLYGLELMSRHNPAAKRLYLDACSMLPRHPDAYVYLSAPDEVLAERRRRRTGEQNHIDRLGPEFHARVRQGYERFFGLDGALPELPGIAERLVIGDAALTPEPLADSVAERLALFLG
jgi:dTMP kinase